MVSNQVPLYGQGTMEYTKYDYSFVCYLADDTVVAVQQYPNFFCAPSLAIGIAYSYHISIS